MNFHYGRNDFVGFEMNCNERHRSIEYYILFSYALNYKIEVAYVIETLTDFEENFSSLWQDDNAHFDR